MAHSLQELLDYPNAVADVSKAIVQRGRSSEENAEVMRRLKETSTWQGAAGDAARDASGRHESTSRGSAEDNLKLAAQARQVWNEATDVAKGIKNIVADANGSDNGEPSMDVDLAMNRVNIPQWIGSLNPKNPDDAKTLEKVEAKVRRLNQRIATALKAGEMVDVDFANVINGGTGGKVSPRSVKEFKLNPDGKPEATGETKAAGLFDKVPIPDQEVLKKDKELGTTTGKGVDKGESGTHETPIGTSKKGKFGSYTKIEDPKGPTVWKGETGEKQDQVNHWEHKGHFLGGDYELTSDQLGYKAGADAQVKQGGITGNEHAGAYLIDNNGNIHWDLGNDGSAGRVEAKIFGNAGVEEYGNAGATGNSGMTFGGGGNAGLHTGQELSYNSEPVTVKVGVDEYAGAGAGGHLTFAETEDHKWKVGGSWGYAWGLGAKPGFEVTVDPVFVGTKMGQLFNWVMN
ncbi:hypothetical protein FZI91_03135 [Mycobacterium sp. CBMA271]|uniref:hypothetical protein n=1 Tax=unclassified Mycobacteroides TaxID=2618759 RepID=UPI0012DD44F1|nr:MULTISPECIES: hypothetical protein [unclassified Mycobacteroides]MUM16355.1 hypothetical protein [Mycobacteroides sp. CBMA 326]MUM20701.1 hypothetical protein [Mycobacteroides sp. CBMA 271]